METLLDDLMAFCSKLTFNERKALITLARSQSMPVESDSPILFSKVRPILDKLVVDPPYVDVDIDTLNPIGSIVYRLLSSPLTTGILIVYALGVQLSDSEVQYGKEVSFTKELCATQTVRRSGEWNWSAFYAPHRFRESIVHPLFPQLSPLQQLFSKGASRLRSSMKGRIILPHYSRRGVSSESSRYLLNKKTYSRKICGERSTFHRKLDRRNVSSLDIVHHYVRTNEWIPGKTELKQRWYPSGLLPRTYFSWSGTDIATAGYLRDFFNDLGDSFPPTHRRNRVKPDWLSTTQFDGGFLFYDLISFTSWFHEQEPFLRATGDYFSGIPVFLVGYDLTLSEHDLGSLIHGYVEWTTSYSPFVVKDGTLGQHWDPDDEFKHQCAGFLGIPGNLVTCTIPHGLAQAAHYADEHELQVPGDDVGAFYKSEQQWKDVMVCASTLGSLQYDKVFRLPQLSIYLKRLVVDLGRSITLAPMLIYPLLPYLIDPTVRDFRSTQYRLPDRKKLHSRAARVLVSFQRDLWSMTKGELDPNVAEIVIVLLRRIHDMTGLPYGAIFQGRLYGSDDPENEHHYTDIAVKFDVEDDLFPYCNPDLVFAGRYVTRMTVRDTAGLEVTENIEELSAGDRIYVRNSKGWRFLEDMGFVDILGIPGEKIELVGSDARDAFLFATEPTLREVRVLSDLRTHQLVAVGVIPPPDVASYILPEADKVSFDYNLQSWRYRRYVDLDDVRSAGFYGRSREWVNDGLSNTRSSLSPEPDGVLDY
jgi:hypothetical protein